MTGPASWFARARPASRAVVGTPDSRDVTLHGVPQDLLGVRMDHALSVLAVDPIECKRPESPVDGTRRLFGKEYEVWDAAHECEGLPVQIGDGHIRRADHAFSSGSRRPMQHRPTGEVSAAADQRDILRQLESLALPELDTAIRLPDPIGIVGVEINRHVPERPAPIDKRRVEVWM